MTNITFKKVGKADAGGFTWYAVSKDGVRIPGGWVKASGPEHALQVWNLQSLRDSGNADMANFLEEVSRLIKVLK